MAFTDGEPAGDITRNLIEWRRGDAEAVNRLFPLIYDRLRSLARGQIRKSPRGVTLDTTGLVHEAYVKFVDRSRVEIHDRQHFFAVAAKAMRHIIVDYARARSAQKRGGGEVASVLDEGLVAVEDRSAEILAIHQALERLEALDRRLIELVELRFFGGLSVEETAEVLGLSERTVRREWQKARAFLMLELSPGGR